MKIQTRRSLLLSAGFLVAGIIGFEVGRLTDEPAVRGGDAPLIGIASLTSDTYIRAVRESGGIPVVLPNTDGSVEKIDEYLERLDGLILPGGADIPPSEYGEETHETVNLLDDERFQFEKAISTAWIEKSDKPLLGICLGSQWINVASGGSLVQDIPSELGAIHRDPENPITHAVSLEPDSMLADIFGETEFDVNSMHHQAVDEEEGLGRNLRVVARAPDGVVEATESTDPDRFLIGVQWHPEKLMPEDARQAKLLKAFVEAAAEARRKR